MKEHGLTILLLALIAVNLYLTIRIAKGLQSAQQSVTHVTSGFTGFLSKLGIHL